MSPGLPLPGWAARGAGGSSRPEDDGTGRRENNGPGSRDGLAGAMPALTAPALKPRHEARTCGLHGPRTLQREPAPPDAGGRG